MINDVLTIDDILRLREIVIKNSTQLATEIKYLKDIKASEEYCTSSMEFQLNIQKNLIKKLESLYNNQVNDIVDEESYYEKK